MLLAKQNGTPLDPDNIFAIAERFKRQRDEVVINEVPAGEPDEHGRVNVEILAGTGHLRPTAQELADLQKEWRNDKEN